MLRVQMFGHRLCSSEEPRVNAGREPGAISHRGLHAIAAAEVPSSKDNPVISEGQLSGPEGQRWVLQPRQRPMVRNPFGCVKAVNVIKAAIASLLSLAW